MITLYLELQNKVGPRFSVARCVNENDKETWILFCLGEIRVIRKTVGRWAGDEGDSK